MTDVFITISAIVAIIVLGTLGKIHKHIMELSSSVKLLSNAMRNLREDINVDIMRVRDTMTVDLGKIKNVLASEELQKIIKEAEQKRQDRYFK